MPHKYLNKGRKWSRSFCKTSSSPGLISDNKILVVGHNMGMIMLDELVSTQLEESPLQWKLDQSVGGLVAYTQQKLIFLKPSTLMNISGPAVKKAAAKFKIGPERIILVHDDLERSLGKVSWKGSGSASGHNGVRSVLETFKTVNIPRIRVGIGRPVDRDAIASFVLSNFTADETRVIRDIVVPLFYKQFQQAVAQSLLYKHF